MLTWRRSRSLSLQSLQGQAQHQEEGQEQEQDPNHDCNNSGQPGLTRAAGEQTREEGRSFTAPQQKDNQEILYLWFMIKNQEDYLST